MEKKTPLVLLVGPTAVGKTDLSLRLAESFMGEIISGDSMQVYRGLNIGTAKVSPEIRKRVPHHLIDIRNPDEMFSVSDFQRLALEAVDRIRERNHLPLLVGGTGLYIRSITHQYNFVSVPGSETYRQRMAEWVEIHGEAALHSRLQGIDPQTASQLHPHDVKRVLRALEIYELSGVTMSEWSQRHKPDPRPDVLLIGLTMDRATLYQRINQRVLTMFEQGWIEEVEGLLASGYGIHLPSMQSLGYKEIVSYLRGNGSLDEAVEKIQRNTRHFAKRQMTWFRRQHQIDWFNVSEYSTEEALWSSIQSYLAGNFTSRAE